MNHENHEEYEDQAEKFSPGFFMIFVPFVVVKVFFDLFI